MVNSIVIALGFIIFVGGLLAVLSLPSNFTETHKLLFMLADIGLAGAIMGAGTKLN